MANDNIPADYVSVKKLQKGEKLPKAIIKRHPAEEKKHGITSLSCSISKDYDFDRYTNLKITGEYTGKASHYALMIFLIYNANHELIEADYDEEVNEGFEGRKTFSVTVQVPIDEFISQVAIRFVHDPVFL